MSGSAVKACAGFVTKPVKQHIRPTHTYCVDLNCVDSMCDHFKWANTCKAYTFEHQNVSVIRIQCFFNSGLEKESVLLII